jgi:nitroreductase
MDFLTLATSRYSVRKFTDTQIEQDKLDRILEAGRVAPTAANRQPQRIYLVKSNQQRDKIKEFTKYDFNSPLYMIIGYDQSVSWKSRYDGHDGGAVDCAIVATQMMLQAWEIGIATTWIASFDPVLMKQVMDLPADFQPVLMFAIGYAIDGYEPSPMHSQRNPLVEGINLFTR